MDGAGGIDKCSIHRGLYFLLHDFEVLPRTADGALCRIHHPAHHEDWLLGHGDHLDEHDHIANGEMAFQRAPENDGVDAEENHSQCQAAECIHGVPPA